MTGKKRAQAVQQLLEWHFQKYRETWADEHSDDRALIAGMYDQLMEAAKSMEKVSNNFVWVSFNHESYRLEREMCDIVKRFTGRYPVVGSGGFESEYYPTF